jgi:hypothetical protein
MDPETVGVVVDFQAAERLLDKMFTDPEILGDVSSAQALMTMSLGLVLLYGSLREEDLVAEKVVADTENIIQYAALVTQAAPSVN